MKREMYCKGCGYDLTRLKNQQCPECGRSFDSANPNTFLWEYGKKLPKGVWFVLILQAIVLVSFLAAYLAYLFEALIGDKWLARITILSFAALPIQALALFFGTCMAVFETRALVPGKRKLFLFLTLGPWLVVILLVIFGGVLSSMT